MRKIKMAVSSVIGTDTSVKMYHHIIEFDGEIWIFNKTTGLKDNRLEMYIEENYFNEPIHERMNASQVEKVIPHAWRTMETDVEFESDSYYRDMIAMYKAQRKLWNQYNDLILNINTINDKVKNVSTGKFSGLHIKC